MYIYIYSILYKMTSYFSLEYLMLKISS